MEEILVIIVSFVGEILLESLLYFPWDIFITSFEKRKEGELNRVGWGFGSLFIGMAIGAISVKLFSDAILPFSWLRILNLILAPLFAGIIALRMSKRRNQKNLTSDNKLHYLIAFLFTLGMIGTRLVLTTKV